MGAVDPLKLTVATPHNVKGGLQQMGSSAHGYGLVLESCG